MFPKGLDNQFKQFNAPAFRAGANKRTKLLLYFNGSSGIGLLEKLLILLYLRFLDLNSLNRRSLERPFDAGLCKFGGLLDKDGLKLAVTGEYK